MSGSLITMAGPANGGIDVRNLSNMEAGLAFLGLVNKIYPGITWGELHAMGMGQEVMGRSFWDRVGGVLSDVKSTVSDVVSKTTSTIGDAAGSALRLVTDEKVIDGASRIGEAYATGGQSEAMKSYGAQLLDFVSHLGSSAKDTATAGSSGSGGNAAGGLAEVLDVYGKPIAWIAGGAVVLVVAAKAFGGNRGSRK